MELPIEDLVLYYIIAFLLLENAIEIYVSHRQVIKYKTTKEVPEDLKDVMTPETFNKARLYGLDREQFSIFKTILKDMLIVSIELYTGFIPFIWYEAEILIKHIKLDPTNEILVSCAFIVLMNSINLIKQIPFKVYGVFSIEQKHGFNKQTWSFFVVDQIKSFVIGQVIFVPIVAATVFIVQHGGQYFFIWLWVFTGIVAFLLLTIYPLVIAPLFDKYRRLEDGPLRESIEKLASSLDFPLTKLYVVEGSKRSAHSNAYLYGLWNNKRIVLFDTLLLNKGKENDSELKEEEKGRGCTDEEVLAILAHELGHWKLGHMLKYIITVQIHLFLMFAVFGYLFQYDPFYTALGFPPGKRPILVGLLIILSYVLAAYNALINVAMMILSRMFEYQADDFAVQLGYGEDLIRALIKLHIDNLSFPVYDWLYSAWNHSHPTLLQRLDKIKENKKKN